MSVHKFFAIIIVIVVPAFSLYILWGDSLDKKEFIDKLKMIGMVMIMVTIMAIPVYGLMYLIFW
jgi:hypothetical protein